MKPDAEILLGKDYPIIPRYKKTIILCLPVYLDTSIANNIWMKKLEKKGQIKVDRSKMFLQFLEFYSYIASLAIVYLQPPKKGLQDQVYITNAAVRLPHLPDVFVLSKFKAEGRQGEEQEVKPLLNALGYRTIQCPYFFEGEAELKWIDKNVYIGGYGIRTSLEALKWIAKNFDAVIIPLKEQDEFLYHLDCHVFPITNDHVLVYTGDKPDTSIKAIEKYANVIPVNKACAYAGITNSVRVGTIVFNATNINELKRDDEDFAKEKEKNETLEKICRELGLELVFFNMSEFLKSGALLSCCVLHVVHDKIYT